VDDKVMPGTLMYQCCEHALRIFTQRMGWVTEKTDVCYEPIPGISSDLKCRGPVTPETRHVRYDVEIREIGYRPEPYVLADAHMFSDELRIVLFKDMTLKLSGMTRDEIEAFWRQRQSRLAATAADPTPLPQRDQLEAFAVGHPSECFGPRYAEFDHKRFIARLPGPPYLFMDRIVAAEPEPWILRPDGWIEAQYDVRPDDWYFYANRLPAMPISVLMEIVLQPCGWLAAYMGSALHSEKDLKFRNLQGSALLHREILPDSGTLTMRARLTQSSEAGDMIIEAFDMQVLQAEAMVYEGNTTFGFFTAAGLAQQVGLREHAGRYQPSAEELQQNRYADRPHVFEDDAPLTPEDLPPDRSPEILNGPGLLLPARALRMIDRIDIYLPEGGSAQLGFVRGIKFIDPEEWFFKAHFYQDPVCPGSLGIDSFVQLLKFAALQRWPELTSTHRFELFTGETHHWTYRGQILPRNQQVTVELDISAVQDGPCPTLKADGFLTVDGLPIYNMQNFGLRLVPVSNGQS
jgi:3-hydroxymyristoyl/3-hydroxydecanoyl-(acyl carrier protein) dehydratase